MKTSFRYFFSTTLLVLVFSQCKKDESIYKGYFYTSKSPSEAKLTLFFDGQNMGELPYVNKNQNGFTADSIKKYALPLAVKAGKHELQAKDPSGAIKSDGKFKVTKNKTSSSGTVGGQELVFENDELRVGISF
jgi:hypothetical protein